MHWNCPHCGITLAVSEEQLGNGWSFSRCYKCGGFALIRRAEINVIKVDKAPPGERVILPESSGNLHIASLNKEATQKLAKHVVSKPKTETPPPVYPQVQSSPLPTLAPVEKNAFNFNTASLPEPLPELPQKTHYSKIIPAGIVTATSLAIISGIYLFIYGSSLWKKSLEANNSAPTQHAVTVAAAPTKKTEPVKADSTVVVTEKGLLDEEEFDSAPAAISLTHNHSQPGAREVASDRLVAKNIITDRVQQRAMAPIKPSPVTKALIVKPSYKAVNIHTGPGVQFPVITKLNQNSKYVVADWSDRWFKIILDGSALKNGTQQVGWVKNDLVKVIAE